MLLKILLLGLVFCLTGAKCSPQQDLKDLVDKLESRLRNLETKFQDEKEKLETRLEAKDKEMETRLEELAENMKEEKDELEKREKRLEAMMSKLRMEESLRNNTALTNPSLHDLPVLLISAWRHNILQSPQTVTFESFLANYNNNGVLDLDSGVFTCFTPGYYTVSFSAHGAVGSHIFSCTKMARGCLKATGSLETVPASLKWLALAM